MPTYVQLRTISLGIAGRALKPIYQAINAEAAEAALDAFENGP